MSTPRTASIQPQVQQAADAANRLADSAEQTVNGVRERVIPAAVRLANQAEDLAHRGYDAVRDRTVQLRERALDASDRGVRYVQEEPVKAVLIAAAVGAALMAVAQFLSHRRSGRR